VVSPPSVDWLGDDELAVTLEVALGRRLAPPLKMLAVDLEALSMLLEAGLDEDGGAIPAWAPGPSA
jgi:hypothetical protein